MKNNDDTIRRLAALREKRTTRGATSEEQDAAARKIGLLLMDHPDIQLVLGDGTREADRMDLLRQFRKQVAYVVARVRTLNGTKEGLTVEVTQVKYPHGIKRGMRIFVPYADLDRPGDDEMARAAGAEPGTWELSVGAEFAARMGWY